MYQFAISEFEFCAVIRLLAADVYRLYSILFSDCGNLLKGDASNIDWDHAVLRWLLSPVYCGLSDWESRFDQIFILTSGNGLQVSSGSFAIVNYWIIRLCALTSG